MSDLIDRKALMESVGVADDCEKCQYNDTMHKGFCTMPSEFVNVCEAIADAPSVEPKTGSWKLHKSGALFVCSACGETSLRTEHYCPNCGAKMRWASEKFD